MPHPLALDYGKPTLYTILFLGDVGDNVYYVRIFAAERSISVAAIALAGTFLGNRLEVLPVSDLRHVPLRQVSAPSRSIPRCW